MIKQFAKKTVVLLFCSALLLSACSKKETASTTPAASSTPNTAKSTPEATKPPAEKPVELVWYYPGPVQKDLSTVNEEVNKYIKEKINVTVKLKGIDFGGYDQKMNTVLAASEDYDIAWSSAAWMLPYVQNVRKGAFLAIDDILAKLPKLKESMPQVMWDNVKVDGKTYAIPNYQTITTREGFVIQKRFADKYKLDVSAIKSYKDLEPFLDQIKKNESGVIPLGDKIFFSSYFYGYWETAAGLVKKDDATAKAIPSNLVPEYKAHLDLMRSWYVKGYIPKDVATAKWDEVIAKGNVAVTYNNVLKPGGEVEYAKKNGNNAVIFVPITDAYIASDTNGTLNAISKKSKNPEKALAFLELVNTDKTLYNLLCFGIEGKHYTKDGEYAKSIKDSGYDPNTDWVFGNQFNALLRQGQDPKTWEITKEWNKTDKISPYMGFNYDTTPVKTEAANVNAVYKEYVDGLNTGTVDPNKYLPEFNDKLKKAGNDKILEVAQKALTEFVQQKAVK